jgi:hypothetical protein
MALAILLTMIASTGGGALPLAAGVTPAGDMGFVPWLKANSVLAADSPFDMGMEWEDAMEAAVVIGMVEGPATGVVSE